MPKGKSKNWRKWLVAYRPDGSVDWNRPKEGSTHFRAHRSDAEPINWQPNEPFRAALKFVEMYTYTNSSTHALFENTETGAQYVMRDQDLAFCLQQGVFIHGLILGEWRFRRDSGRCSIVPIELISTYEYKKSK